MAGASFMALLAKPTYIPPATSYANTGGTGNRTGVITATNLGTAFGLGSITSLIDGATGNSCYFTMGATGYVLNFDFLSAKYIDEIRIKTNVGGTATGTWQMLGSNDNTNFVSVGAPFVWNGVPAGTTFPMVHASPAAYRYYQFTQISGTTTNTDYQLELEFKIG